MKSVYTLVPILLLSLLTPRLILGQCNCSGGIPATAIDHYVTLPVTSSATATIYFPQFDPSIGILSCLRLSDSITGVSQMTLYNRNIDTIMVHDAATGTDTVKTLDSTTTYTFLLTVSNDIEGPGISIVSPFTKIYGPEKVGNRPSPDTIITHGPDTVFKDATGVATADASSSGPYYGTGNIGFTYTINGGLNTLQGGLNYFGGPKTTYWGTFHLTYYWCPATVLATSITQFTATPNGSTVLLQWLTTNQQPNTTYEVQVSTDGKTFTDVATTQGDPSPTGTTSKYQYQFHPDPATMGKLYFRIRETNGAGKIAFSQVAVLDPMGNSSANGGLLSYQAFPNPATNTLLLQFSNNQTGRFLLELVNTAGQVVQQKAVTMTESNQIRLDFNPQPGKGLYFLRTTDLTNNRNYVSKVFIN